MKVKEKMFIRQENSRIDYGRINNVVIFHPTGIGYHIAHGLAMIGCKNITLVSKAKTKKSDLIESELNAVSYLSENLATAVKDHIDKYRRISDLGAVLNHIRNLRNSELISEILDNSILESLMNSLPKLNKKTGKLEVDYLVNTKAISDFDEFNSLDIKPQVSIFTMTNIKQMVYYKLLNTKPDYLVWIDENNDFHIVNLIDKEYSYSELYSIVEADKPVTSAISSGLRTTSQSSYADIFILKLLLDGGVNTMVIYDDDIRDTAFSPENMVEF